MKETEKVKFQKDKNNDWFFKVLSTSGVEFTYYITEINPVHPNDLFNA